MSATLVLTFNNDGTVDIASRPDKHGPMRVVRDITGSHISGGEHDCVTHILTITRAPKCTCKEETR